MPKPAKILLLIVIVALLPLRGIAAAMAGSCPAAQDEIAAAQSSADVQDTQAGSRNADAHCPGAVFLPATARAPLPAQSGERGLAFANPATLTFIPDQLDPPPLSLLR